MIFPIAFLSMISIIVPIYKVEDYLAVCIDSILASTYQDFELILVDDGSPDNCGKICDEYASKDGRIRVIHKQNGGLSDARNAGLKVTKGEYVAFVDSDDVIHARMLEVLHGALTRGDYDLSMVHGIKVYDKEYIDLMKRDVDVQALPLKAVTQDEFHIQLYSYCSFQYQVVWNKLYKRELVSDMTFCPYISEDVEWNTRVCMRMRKAIVAEADLYYYVQRSGSVMADGRLEKSDEWLKAYLQCLEDIPEEKTSYRAACMKAMYSAMFFLRKMARGTAYYDQVISSCKEMYAKTKGELMQNDAISWSKKLRMAINCHCPAVYNMVQDVLNRLAR